MTLIVTISLTVYFVTQFVSHLLLRAMTDCDTLHDDRVWLTVYITACDTVKLVCLMVLMHTLAF